MIKCMVVTSLDEPVIRKLLKRIYSQGHEIALHPIYYSYNDVNQLSYGHLEKPPIDA